MTHWAENSKRLKIRHEEVGDFLKRANSFGDVCLFQLPEHSELNRANLNSAIDSLVNITESLKDGATLVVLGDSVDLVHVHERVGSLARYQLWISIKSSMVRRNETLSGLDNFHFGALVYSKYNNSLRHAKTRIAYSYCPACEKTTKDYGGKKHTYHEYGTLMSDVWRDIPCELGGDILPLVDRFADMFGIDGYHDLVVIKYKSVIHGDESNEGFAKSNPTGRKKGSTVAQSKLINGDCLEAMRGLQENSVDFAFADPPYNLRKNYKGYDDSLEVSEYFKWCDEWIAEMARVLKPGRTLALLNIPLWSIRHFLFLEKTLTFQNWLVWEALSYPVRQIMPAHYTVLCFSKGPARKINVLGPTKERDTFDQRNKPLVQEPLAEGFCLRAGCVRSRDKAKVDDRGPLTDLWWDIHRLKHNNRRVDHPCQVPPHLMYRLISIFTNPGEIVLDCFNGAGTTTLAAEQLGRRYIGIEAALQYHKLATERHKEVENGLDPFRKMERVLESKNSPVPRLAKQKYVVPKKTLQLEVKRIAASLNRLPTKEDLIKYGKYPFEYYERYFVSWGEVCAAARTTGMKETRTSNHSVDSSHRPLGLFQEVRAVVGKDKKVSHM
jgi:DNA modification methylase